MTARQISAPLDKVTGRPNRKVRIVLAWGHYPVGAVIEPDGTTRSFLVQYGYAETVPAKTPLGMPKLGKYTARFARAAE